MTKAKDEIPAMEPITRTSTGLRDAIFDEIDAIRNGASNPTRANAIAKLSSGVLETVRIEMEVEKHLRASGERTNLVKDGGVTPLQLGA